MRGWGLGPGTLRGEGSETFLAITRGRGRYEINTFEQGAGVGSVIFALGIRRSEFSFHKTKVSASGMLRPQTPHYIYSFYSFSLRYSFFLFFNQAQKFIIFSVAAGIFLSVSLLVYGPCTNCSVALGSISSQRPAFLFLTLLYRSLIHGHTEYMEITREGFGFTFDLRGMLLSLRGYKTFFMLNSTEHEIFPAHKC